ncbi:hypothetical protein [Demequina sp. NBRC 110054]|uniref:hypothetical protein n=1 Tax=Demequina sp. NBRC 110054 TaxID=1570343 RepID=UPI000A01B9E5|nr:hypothetical protein [Demequina sp. NBRC 110054]
MTGPFSRALVAASVVALVATMLSGCAVLGDGPLGVDDGNAICGYVTTEGAVKYFGTSLDNQGNADAAVILKVRATSARNVAEVDLLVQDAEPVMSLEWPSDEPFAANAMADAVAPGEDAVVAPGAFGTLLVAITPEDASSKARIDEIAITYRSGGHVHTVFSRLRIVLAPSDSC